MSSLQKMTGRTKVLSSLCRKLFSITITNHCMSNSAYAYMVQVVRLQMVWSQRYPVSNSSPLGIQQWASLTIPDLEERTILTLLQTALTSSHRALIYLVLMLTSVRAFFSLLTNVILVAILVLTFSGSASRPLASVMYIVPWESMLYGKNE